MFVPSPKVLVPIAIVATALAQVLLKKSSYYEVRSFTWFVYMGASGAVYCFSFILYSRILKYFALNKIYPVMTIAQIMIVSLVGLLIGEAMGGRHVLGLACGMVAIYLILS
ncbi:hypothetical protein SAMN02745206_00923 [Desulfacinum infernum DSM 9756]|uniref:EamA-like transporter family protein n=2 Tax=Desulfacinum infernum TaxID=35837 RepID=A0A1M4WXD2_9BACT|nr:hypothetical protein SAMN02745206_00923 [Desulfacinum infernum DSM 9756]